MNRNVLRQRACRVFVVAWATAVVLAGGPVAAADPARQGPTRQDVQRRVAKRADEMTQRLQLTEAQQEQIRPILKAATEQLLGLREQYRNQTASPETARALQHEMQEIRRTTRAELTPLLSAEQLEQYDELQQEWQTERRRWLRQRKGQQRDRATVN